MLRVGILTREWPPDVYGGAGVHVDELVRELRPLADVHVHCFGPTRTGATGHPVPAAYEKANPALQTVAVGLDMARVLDKLGVYGVFYKPMTRDAFNGYVRAQLEIWKPQIMAAGVAGQ